MKRLYTIWGLSESSLGHDVFNFENCSSPTNNEELECRCRHVGTLLYLLFKMEFSKFWWKFASSIEGWKSTSLQSILFKSETSNAHFVQMVKNLEVSKDLLESFWDCLGKCVVSCSIWWILVSFIVSFIAFCFCKISKFVKN